MKQPEKRKCDAKNSNEKRNKIDFFFFFKPKNINIENPTKSFMEKEGNNFSINIFSNVNLLITD